MMEDDGTIIGYNVTTVKRIACFSSFCRIDRNARIGVSIQAHRFARTSTEIRANPKVFIALRSP